MGWDADLEELMPDTVTVYASARPAADGSDTFSTSGTAYRARVTYDPAVVLRSAGPVGNVDAVAWLNSTTAIAQGAKAVLPGSVTRVIRQATRVSDQDGQHHVKLLLGSL